MSDKQTEAVAEKEKQPEKKVKVKKSKPITIKANKKGRHISGVMNFLRIVIIPFYYLIKPFKYIGKRKVKDGACIYICNHYTVFDCIYVANTTWECVHFVAKKPIFEAPILGPFARSIKAISANRDGSDVRTLMNCLKCLKNGEKVAIFPEGTRNKTNEVMLPFYHGAAIMAIKAKAPIVPMLIYKKPKVFRKTHIVMGEPFELSEYYDRKLTDEEMEQANQRLWDVLMELREQHTQFLENKKKKKNKNKAQ